jgi:hypothetical protein
MKSCNDQLMFSHMIIGIPHGILYLGQWELWLEPQTYQVPYPKIHMMFLHYYDLVMEPIQPLGEMFNHNQNI